MEEHCKSLALQYDLFINNTIKLLDTAIERDYIVKLKTIDELACKIHNGEDDKTTIKKTLEAVQDECTKLSFKIKTSARLLDEAQVEKENILVENKTLKSQLEQLYSLFKKPDTTETSQTCHSHCFEYAQPNEKKTLNNTDALLSDLSYSFSEDSSYCNLTKNSKPKYATVKKCSTNNVPTNIKSKSCEIKNVKGECGQIIATTTVTVDLDGINAKSIIKNQAVSTSSKPQSISSSSTDSLSSNELDKHIKHSNCNKLDKNIEKIHDFVQKIVVIPEICGQCHKKVKFNNYMVKCLDCKIVAHLECKDLLSDMCTLDPNIIFALNCGIPPLIVYCVNEIEKRGLDINDLYRASGSDEEVKKLINQFHKVVPKLSNVDIHVICDCLKNFIRMQLNLISQSDFSKLADALKKDNGSLSEGVIELPPINRKILAFLILHLQNVINSPQCCTDYNSLAIVFGPIIVDLSSPICINDLHIETEIIFKVLMELLKLPRSFWNNMLKIDTIASDELLHSTPSRKQYKKQPPALRFFSSGSKKRILDLPKKKELRKVEFEKKFEFSD
ncbi:Rho GTPase-activating protein domain,Protein kinase C-like, phorbol ester/diacylglycerol-binding [Cinara cedri]|uniref:Rho GTPase-activating protein domain,Protein kinase C-like, phorbol ester/diacylglycerol-binding n=1 Tax=Cinara cedri TaxID=506608 RepID=A0A5E4MQV3_9HEMI|nr:Rho GTPase-activating protein domain,Protein kinase C-like, phorbol ester/diacylglycerol-binding [Cinara cedri]